MPTDQPTVTTNLPHRTLSVGGVEIKISVEAALHLIEADIVYPCGDGHDLHLSPEGPGDNGWELEHVEALVQAFARDAARVDVGTGTMPRPFTMADPAAMHAMASDAAGGGANIPTTSPPCGGFSLPLKGDADADADAAPGAA